MTFRQLGWRQLQEAEDARSATVLRNLRNMGGELLRDLQTINRDQVQEEAQVQTATDPVAKYDQATILKYGITAWSYPEKLNADNLDNLDAATAAWAAGEIIRLGTPPAEVDVEASFLGSQNGSTENSAAPVLAFPANGSSV
jgi:hypothetical protein